jgi:hypothetical protein
VSARTHPLETEPTGDIGPIGVTQGENGTEAHWHKLGFPTDKGGQEQFVTRLFVSAIERQESLKFEVEKLPEADHDALLKRDRTEIDLQLMEIVIRPKQGSPYKSTPREYNSGQFADYVIADVKRKLYAKGARSIWLLLYSTHWRFVPSSHVLYLLNDYFKKNQHAYDRVFAMELLDKNAADVSNIFPTLQGQKIDAFPKPRNVQEARAQNFRVADPADAKAQGNNLVWKL